LVCGCRRSCIARFTSRFFRVQPELWQEILSGALLIAGAAIYLWCAWDFSVKGHGTPAPIDAPINLVVNGLYRFVRNPMYVAVFLLIASRAILFWSFPIVLYLVFVRTCVQLFIVLYEEPHLRKSSASNICITAGACRAGFPDFARAMTLFAGFAKLMRNAF